MLYRAIHWNDSASSLKAVLLTGPIVRFLAAEQILTPAIASNALVAVLQGLQTHGQHDSNQVDIFLFLFFHQIIIIITFLFLFLIKK